MGGTAFYTAGRLPTRVPSLYHMRFLLFFPSARPRPGPRLASVCRERPSHGEARVAGALDNDQIWEFAGAVDESTDFVRVCYPGGLGETGCAVLLPLLLAQPQEGQRRVCRLCSCAGE
jgi:hypothetical protein